MCRAPPQYAYKLDRVANLNASGLRVPCICCINVAARALLSVLRFVLPASTLAGGHSHAWVA